MHDKGALLISGSGADYKKRHIGSIVSILTLAVIFLVAMQIDGVSLFDLLGDLTGGRHQNTALLMVGVFISCIYDVVRIGLRTATKVNVYENLIEGTGLVLKGIPGLGTVQEYSLTFQQVSDVANEKGNENAITINAFGSKYTCYCKNANYIREKINEKLQSKV